jgi:hypothetical protein
MPDAPDVHNLMEEADRHVTWDIVAFRRLSKSEMMGAIRHWYASEKRNPNRGERITIVTTTA